MEQLVNELLKLISKSGGASMITELIHRITEDDHATAWQQEEVEKATAYVRDLNTYFSRVDAVEIIENLIEKFHIRLEDIRVRESEGFDEKIGVGELQ
jgi:hypothetical protein